MKEKHIIIVFFVFDDTGRGAVGSGGSDSRKPPSASEWIYDCGFAYLAKATVKQKEPQAEKVISTAGSQIGSIDSRHRVECKTYDLSQARQLLFFQSILQ